MFKLFTGKYFFFLSVFTLFLTNILHAGELTLSKKKIYIGKQRAPSPAPLVNPIVCPGAHSECPHGGGDQDPLRSRKKMTSELLSLYA